MTKSEVKNMLTNAIAEYNEAVEEYARSCNKNEAEIIRAITSFTMDCFANFSDVIEKMAE